MKGNPWQKKKTEEIALIRNQSQRWVTACQVFKISVACFIIQNWQPQLARPAETIQMLTFRMINSLLPTSKRVRKKVLC